MMGAVKDSLEILKRAQFVDRKLYTSLERLSQIPQERASLKRSLETEKVAMGQLESSLKTLLLKQKGKEGELSQKEGNVRKLDGQHGQVKTNKEYSALQQEIASLKADNALLEEEIIKLFDEVEAAEEEVQKEKERLKQIEKELTSRDQELVLKEETLRESVDQFKKQREAILSQVPPEIKNLYDTIVPKKQGVGLVKVNGESCGACLLQLRPQLLNEVRLGESIVVCENCSRILYFED